MKFLFKNKRSLVWIIVTCVLVVFLTVLTVLSQTVFFQTIGTFLGRPKPVYKEGSVAMYDTDTVASKEEALANANEKTVEMCEEGTVLLENKNNALPLARGASVSVFGKNSVNLSYGGSGSSGFRDVKYKTIYDSLDAAGFECNDTLRKFYEDDSRSGPKRAANSSDLDSGGNQKIAAAETPLGMYPDDVRSSYADYNDAAIVVITRIGGEGFDLPRYQGDTEGAVAPDSHYLELDANERALLENVCNAGFGKVIVVLNTPSAIEAGFLNVPDYLSCADKIDAALWIGFTGGEGIMALGGILNGDVTPSGHTADTWVADFSKDPTFVNFGTGCHPDATDKYDDGLYYFVDYEEGIYVGYRYYETRGASGVPGGEGETWYNENVVYPFGYGLSYTTFGHRLVSVSESAISEGEEIVVEVEVENTGDVKGKDVVQIYAQAPYTPGGIEKAHKVLVGFAKTSELEKGEKETLSISIDPYDMASYDYRDANKNGFAGYELEAGMYTLHISENAHDAFATADLTLASEIRYDKDPVTGNTVGNRYTKDYSVTATDLTNVSDSDMQLSTILSRAAWDDTFPDENTAEERKATTALMNELKDVSHNNPTDFTTMDYPDFGEDVVLQVKDILPLEQPEESYLPFIPYEGGEWDEKWETLLAACKEDELIKLYNYGAYQTVAVESINMPLTIGSDGPAGFTCFVNKSVGGTCHYCSEPVMASTWNAELIETFGLTMGDEALMGDGTSAYSAIYAPGINIHRSPFGGRTAEYFSEDPFLSGKLAAAEIRGAQTKGLICMVKHFVANEQETHRSINGDCSWLTEQSLREIYLRPFEIAVKEGQTRGLMSSFNRIGTKWTGGDYRLLTEILRDEWGFRGTVICDFNTVPQYMNSRQMAYAGGDLNLATTPVDWCDTSDLGDAVMLRQSAKNILYTFINSNAMRGEVDYYTPPLWTVLLYVGDAVIAVALAVWGFFAVRHALKKSRGASEKQTHESGSDGGEEQ